MRGPLDKMMIGRKTGTSGDDNDRKHLIVREEENAVLVDYQDYH